MTAISTVLVVIIVSLLITRVASVALELTGMSQEMARFQARSAFTGVGFTTSEAEAVVTHPVRRRIIMLLMLLGRAGVVTAVAGLTVSFASAGTREAAVRFALLAVGLVVVFAITRSRLANRLLSRWIAKILTRLTHAPALDYASLLHLTGEYGVIEMRVEREHWVAGRSLDELRLRDEGVTVLGIEKPGGGYIGAPTPQARIETGDTLIVYARNDQLRELAQRKTGSAGDDAHMQAARHNPSQ